MVSKAVRKISNLFTKKKKAGRFLRVKIKTPIIPPFFEPRPIIKPKKEIEFHPEWEEELV